MSSQVNLAVIEFKSPSEPTSGRVTLFAPGGAALIRVLSEDEATAAIEEQIQIFEAVRYEYEVEPPDFRLVLQVGAGVGAVKRSENPRHRNCGSIDLGSYVGRLRLRLEDEAGVEVAQAAIEVCSRKLSYRDDLRSMLEDICGRAVELALSHKSPTTFRALPDPASDAKVLYQQFAFLSGLLKSKPFSDALNLIQRRPHEKLDSTESLRALSSGLRPSSRLLRSISRGGNRAVVPNQHPVFSAASSLPIRVAVTSSAPTVDTQENSFVRFALLEFVAFLLKIVSVLELERSDEHSRIKKEALSLVDALERASARYPLVGLSNLKSIPFSSTVLQNRAGYREIFQAWIKFDLAARLTWSGATDVYDVGQRDVATLYEYWVFFRLLDVLSAEFTFDSNLADKLFEVTQNGLSMKLRSGESLSFFGGVGVGVARINLRFDYNRMFDSKSDVRLAGSWTERMQPDYTLSLWLGEGIGEDVAAERGALIHVHFDAKYKVSSIEELFDSESQIPGSSASERRVGKHKRVDLLKMHAYRDAIRRTAGAYILYPGSAEKRWQGYHELLPGLGAFAVRPGLSSDGLQKFIGDLKIHLVDGSVRERVSSFSAAQYSL